MTDDDYTRYGGPIAPGNLMTLLLACRRDEYADVVPHELFDMGRMAREINSWLVLVGDTVSGAAADEHSTH